MSECVSYRYDLDGMDMPDRDFDSIYANYSRLVYWAAYGVVGNKEQAEDVSQNVFISVLKHMDTVNTLEDAPLKGWLYRVAVNAALDSKRRVKREVLSDDPVGRDVADTSVSVEAEAERNSTQSMVREAVMQLDDIFREPLSLHYFSGLSVSDIAEVLDISPGTVKSRMSRGRAQLAVQLREKGCHL